MKRTVLCVMCLLLIGVTAQAWDVINVEFARDTYTNIETGEGALGNGTATWNLFGSPQTLAPNSVTKMDLVDSAGNATAVDIVYDCKSRGAFVAATTAIQCVSLPVTNGQYLMQSYLTVQNSTNYVYVQGLVAGSSYDLYLFGHGDNETQNTQFTINGITKGSTIAVTGLTTLTENAHYVVFSGIVADSNGEIDISFANGLDNAWAAFNGMQIVAVPEPATLLLLGMGGLISLKRRVH